MSPDSYLRPNPERARARRRLLGAGAVAAALLLSSGCASDGAESLQVGGTAADPEAGLIEPVPTTADPEPGLINPVPSTEAGQPRTPTSLVEPPPVEEQRPAPKRAPDLSIYSGNPNTPEGEMGTLCWARWEVGRYFVLYAAPDADLEVLLEQFAGSVEEASEASGAALPPPELERFSAWLTGSLVEVAELLETAKSSPADTFDAAGRILDFEYAPDVRAYADMADADPNCARP